MELDGFITLLNALDRELTRLPGNVHVEIEAVGGFALLNYKIIDRSTHDLDSFNRIEPRILAIADTKLLMKLLGVKSKIQLTSKYPAFKIFCKNEFKNSDDFTLPDLLKLQENWEVDTFDKFHLFDGGVS